jgi:hypothetical protein
MPIGHAGGFFYSGGRLLTKYKVRHGATGTFVPALVERRPPATIAPIDVQPLLPMAAQTGHARQDDSAITHAKATLLVAAAYIFAAGMITLGLLLVVWLFRGLGDGWATYTYTGLVVWGVATLLALWSNRKQSLWHSPTGIAHHELDSRERLAKHAIDTHAKLLLRRWDIDNER